MRHVLIADNPFWVACRVADRAWVARMLAGVRLDVSAPDVCAACRACVETTR